MADKKDDLKDRLLRAGLGNDKPKPKKKKKSTFDRVVSAANPINVAKNVGKASLTASENLGEGLMTVFDYTSRPIKAGINTGVSALPKGVKEANLISIGNKANKDVKGGLDLGPIRLGGKSTEKWQSNNIGFLDALRKGIDFDQITKQSPTSRQNEKRGGAGRALQYGINAGGEVSSDLLNYVGIGVGDDVAKTISKGASTGYGKREIASLLSKVGLKDDAEKVLAGRIDQVGSEALRAVGLKRGVQIKGVGTVGGKRTQEAVRQLQKVRPGRGVAAVSERIKNTERGDALATRFEKEAGARHIEKTKGKVARMDYERAQQQSRYRESAEQGDWMRRVLKSEDAYRKLPQEEFRHQVETGKISPQMAQAADALRGVLDEGFIRLDDMEGNTLPFVDNYVPRNLSKEARKAIQKKDGQISRWAKALPEEPTATFRRLKAGDTFPGTKIVLQDGSTREINEISKRLFGKELFDTDVVGAVRDYGKSLGVARRTTALNEGLQKAGLGMVDQKIDLTPVADIEKARLGGLLDEEIAKREGLYAAKAATPDPADLRLDATARTKRAKTLSKDARTLRRNAEDYLPQPNPTNASKRTSKRLIKQTAGSADNAAAKPAASAGASRLSQLEAKLMDPAMQESIGFDEKAEYRRLLNEAMKATGRDRDARIITELAKRADTKMATPQERQILQAALQRLGVATPSDALRKFKDDAIRWADDNALVANDPQSEMLDAAQAAAVGDAIPGVGRAVEGGKALPLERLSGGDPAMVEKLTTRADDLTAAAMDMSNMARSAGDEARLYAQQRQVLSDEIAKSKKSSARLISDMKKVKTDDWLQKLEPELKWYNDLYGEQFLVDADVRQALQRFDDLRTKGVGTFWRQFDAIHSAWKGFQLLTPGFHIRNAMGGVFNNWLAGVDSMFHIKVMRNLQRLSKGGLDNVADPQIRAALGAAREMGIIHSGGGAGLTAELKSMGLKEGGSRFNPLSSNFGPFQANRAVGDRVEDSLRATLFVDSFLKNGGDADLAFERVMRFHYDYSAISDFERTYMKRIFPFFTFTRFNFPLQLEMLAQQPGKYTRFAAIQQGAQQSMPQDDERPAWLGDFALRSPLDFGGNPTYLTPDLMYRDLGVVGTESPSNYLLRSTNPLIQQALQQATGKQLGRDYSLKNMQPKDADGLTGIFARLLGMDVDENGQIKRSDYETVRRIVPITKLDKLFGFGSDNKNRRTEGISSILAGLGMRIDDGDDASDTAQIKPTRSQKPLPKKGKGKAASSSGDLKDRLLRAGL